ncbi:MAG: hypothetical protein WC639_04830 [Patescibacteria group bacterium]|jgi:hypothetical protein
MATEIKLASKFGKPTLASANNGKAMWIRGSTSPLDQKGSSGWLAELYGGVQTGDDWARINIPVNEMLVTQLKTVEWSYYMTNEETMGVGMVIWVHNPTDFDKRAEITQLGSTVEKAAGWDASEFTSATSGMFYYGENTTGTALVAGTQYTWAQFQADALFKSWTIYRITFDYGWEASGTFESAYVADIKINNEQIELKPFPVNHRKTVLATKTIVDGAHSADDVVCEDADNTEGTDWDFDFSGTGYITKAIITCAKTALTSLTELQLYSAPPTCELDDNAAGVCPVAADIPYFIGSINFPAMKDVGTGQSFAVTVAGEGCGLPMAFDSPKLYGVLIDKTGTDWDASLMSILLTADMDD